MNKRKIFGKSVVGVLGIIAILAVPGFLVKAQTILYVDPTDPYAYHTIQDAINAANDGDIIKVNPGIYHENIIVNKSLKIIGDPIIDGDGGVGITITSSNVWIENFTIYNCSTAIYVHNASFTIQNVVINNCTIYNYSYAGYGIYFDDVEQSIINNTQINDTYAAIFFRTSSYNKITNNTNIFDNSFGIYFQGGGDNIISFNNITRGNYGMYITSSNNNVISNNNISRHPSQVGIWLYYSQGTTITNNVLYKNKYDITITNSPDGIFLNNTVASYPTTFDINDYGGDFTISGVATPPAMPDGFANISKFLEITANTGAWLNLTIYYEPEDVTVNEWTLHTWKWNGTAWNYDGWYGFHDVDTINHAITVNITSFGDPIFAPLQDITPPTTVKDVGSPSYGEFVTSDTPIWLNATDNANGSGVNATYYRIWYNNAWHPDSPTDVYCGNENITYNGTAYWYVYYNESVNFGPIYFHEECMHMIEYYSVDNAGNEEEHHLQAHFVDNTPPTVTKEYGEPYYYEKLVDQEQTLYDNFYWAYDLYLWQSFVPDVSKIDAVQLLLMIDEDTQGVSYPVQLDVSICDAGMNVLATNVTIWNADFTGWIQFHFDSSIDVTPGQTYYIKISYNKAAVFWAASSTNPYPDGTFMGTNHDAAFKTEYYSSEYITKNTPIYLNATDMPTEVKLNGTHFVWVTWHPSTDDIMAIVHSYVDTINISVETLNLSSVISLDDLTWDSLNSYPWDDRGYIVLGDGDSYGYYLNPPSGTQACLIRFNVSWAETGEEFAYVIAEAVVSYDGTWQIQQFLINFDIHNNHSIAVNDFELELYGITPEDIFDYYNGWGAPPEINEIDGGVEVIWKGNAIYPCNWTHFGLEINPSAVVTDVIYNWTYHCNVGSYRIWYRIWYNGTWSKWYHGNWNENVVFDLSIIGDNNSCEHIIQYYAEDDLGNRPAAPNDYCENDDDPNPDYYLKPGYRYGPDRLSGTADDDTYKINQLYGPNGIDDPPAGPAGGDDAFGPDGQPGVAGVDDDGDLIVDEWDECGWPGSDDGPWGAGWCVPSSAASCLWWFADWYNLPQLKNNAADIYQLADMLGKNYMNTNPNSGTLINNKVNGLKNYIRDCKLSNVISVSHKYNPTYQDLVENLTTCQDVLFGTSTHVMVATSIGLNPDPVTSLVDIDLMDPWIGDYIDTIFNASNNTIFYDGKWQEFYDMVTICPTQFAEEQTVYVDNIPPSIEKEYGTPYYTDGIDEWITSDTTIYVNVTDTGICAVGSIHLNISIYSFLTGSYTYYETSVSGGTIYVEFTLPEECKHWINLTAWDDLGNTAYLNQTVYVDNTPPSGYVSIGVPSAGNHLTTHTDIQIIATDEGECPVRGYYIKYNIWNESDGWMYDINDETTWPTFHNANPILNFNEECMHYLVFNVSDELGNYRLYNYTFYVDDTPPTSTITPENHSFVHISTPIIITATDGPDGPCSTGVREIDYRIWRYESDAWVLIQDWVTGGSTVTFNFTEECIHKVEFYAVDPLENTEQVKWVIYYVDVTPPTTGMETGNPKVTAGGDTYYVTTHTPIWLNASDLGCNGGAGVAELHYTIIYEGYPYEFVVYDNGEGDWNDSVGNISVNISFNEECNHTLIYWAIDYVGNIEEQNTAYFLVDDTPPTINLTIGEPKYDKNGMLFITSNTPIWANASDSGMTEECTVGSVYLFVEVWNAEERYSLWEGPLMDYVADGWASIGFTINEECIHWINITAIDDLGNIAYYNYTVYVDNTPPILKKEIGTPKYQTTGDFVSIWNDSFEDGDASDWTIGGTGYVWVVSNMKPTWATFTYKDGTYFLLTDDDAVPGTRTWTYAITPPINCNGYTNVQLSFAVDFEDYAGDGEFWVNVSNDGGATWTNVWYETEDYDGFVTLDISSIADGNVILINFTYDDDNEWAWGAIIDNITVSGLGQIKYITSHTPIYLNITDDGLCKVNSLHVRVGIWYDGEWYYSWQNVTESPLNLTVYLGGECIHYLNITMYDDLGNVAYDNETFYVDNSNPNSHVDAIVPYCQEVNESHPLRINATVFDLPEICASGIYNVSLYYRYAPYNHSFGNWTKFGEAIYDDVNNKWFWQFTAPEGPGYYQFYSIAYDNLGNKEIKNLQEAILCVKLNMPITLHTGWNLITIPIKTNWTAHDLAMNITGCTLVVKWNALSQNYTSHYVPWDTLNNFDIEPGVGYWIYVKQNTSLRVIGCLIEEINVTLYPELNLLGWANLHSTNMSKVIDEGKGIPGVSYGNIVAVWNSSSQEWAIQIIGLPQMPDNEAYELTIGEAFFVYRSENNIAYWTGGRNF